MHFLRRVPRRRRLTDSGSGVRIGVDTGGTFTDVAALADAELSIRKVPSTPAAPEQAVLSGLTGYGGNGQYPSTRVVHGTTVATNALLERRWARTVYLANRGFTDVLALARQARGELFDLQPPPPLELAPRALCVPVAARRDARGGVVTELTEAECERVAHAVVDCTPDAVAINLLFSYLSGEDESRLRDAIRRRYPDGHKPPFICVSHAVLADQGEYERGVATWVNAALGPTIQGYLGRLAAAMERRAGMDLRIMHSAGGTLTPAAASSAPVQLLLSGPAGGLAGALAIGELTGRARLLTLDMGGTSTDVALLDGAIPFTAAATLAALPIAVPMVDVQTIGAGGGSIARVDAARGLRVGPESAGAEPGPACYGLGGREATVTDAQVVLGRIPTELALGGIRLDPEAAEAAVGRLAQRLDTSVARTAEAIVALANEAMAEALRVMSVNRHADPRRLTLLSFGGAGGLHVCDLAEALEMSQALVPIHSGVLSAVGMVVAEPTRVLTQAIGAELAKVSRAELQRWVRESERAARQDVVAEAPGAPVRVRWEVGLRYRGQSLVLHQPLRVGPRWAKALADHFVATHHDRFGYTLELPVELARLRLTVSSPTPPLRLPRLAPALRPDQGLIGQSDKPGIRAPVAMFARNKLGAGQSLKGPCLVVEETATTWIAERWQASVDPWGNLMMTRAR